MLDYEAWSVPWERAGALYQNASIALASAKMPPGSPREAVEKRARASYNRAAVGFLAKTAKYVKSLRPKARVGEYVSE